MYLCLAVCVSISSTGTSDTKKIASKKADKRITKEKNGTRKQEKCLSCAV